MALMSQKLQLLTILTTTGVPHIQYAKSKEGKLWAAGKFAKQTATYGITDKLKQQVESFVTPLLTEDTLSNMRSESKDFDKSFSGKYLIHLYKVANEFRHIVLIGGLLTHGTACMFSEDGTLLYTATRLGGFPKAQPSVTFTFPPTDPLIAALEAESGEQHSVVQLADCTIDERTRQLRMQAGTASFSLLMHKPDQLLVLTNV